MKKKILIVSANYYGQIAKNLLNNAKKTLGNKFILKIINVPGAFEIPVIISRYLKSYHGAIALGCIIKGQTPHFNFISQAITNSLIDLSVAHKKPIGNGVLTCLNRKQARQRYTKGKEAAKAVLNIISL